MCGGVSLYEGNPLPQEVQDVEGTGKVGQRSTKASPKISLEQRKRAGLGLGREKGATSTICPKSSTYIFSVSTSSLKTYLGREQECTSLV